MVGQIYPSELQLNKATFLILKLREMHLSPTVAKAAVRSKEVVLLLLTCC